MPTLIVNRYRKSIALAVKNLRGAPGAAVSLYREEVFSNALEVELIHNFGLRANVIILDASDRQIFGTVTNELNRVFVQFNSIVSGKIVCYG